MRVLALDLGTHCGWSIFDEGVPVAGGTWTLQSDRQRRFEGGGMKWLRFRDLLSQLPSVDRVALEEVRRHMGVDAAHAYGGALAVVSSWCEERKVPYEAIPVATIKKHATGKGNAKKPQMMEAARSRWPNVALDDDNHADALWIGDLVASSAAKKVGT